MTPKRIWPGCVISLAVLLLTTNVFAHETRPAYLEVRQKDDTSYHILWKVPLRQGSTITIHPQFPKDMKLNLVKQAQSEESVVSYYEAIYEGNLQGEDILITGLDLTLVDVLIRVLLRDELNYTLLAQPGNPRVRIPREPLGRQVLTIYSKLGIEHIWMGPDHLLFVLCLVLIIKRLRLLIETITAFTVAHSITLGLAATSLIKIAPPPVEVVIALSIVFLARELYRTPIDGKTLAWERPWLVAFIFGLLHGLGFAGALQQIGLPQQAVLGALFSFNLGVEVGQLIFVVIIWQSVRQLSKWSREKSIFIYRGVSLGVGSIATFWLIERIAQF